LVPLAVLIRPSLLTGSQIWAHNQKLVALVVDNFSSFRDVSTYRGEPGEPPTEQPTLTLWLATLLTVYTPCPATVPILKRAQILVADVWGCTLGIGRGRFDDIGCLTMFADYRCVYCYWQASRSDLHHLTRRQQLPVAHPMLQSAASAPLLWCIGLHSGTAGNTGRRYSIGPSPGLRHCFILCCGCEWF